jgi:hypothetical protein
MVTAKPVTIEAKPMGKTPVLGRKKSTFNYNTPQPPSVQGLVQSKANIAITAVTNDLFKRVQNTIAEE